MKDKKDTKIKYVVLMLILILTALIIVICISASKKSQENVSEYDKKLDSKVFDGVIFSNFKLENGEDDQTSKLSLLITNNSEEKVEQKFISLKFIDKNEDEIKKVVVLLPTMDEETSTNLEVIVSKDIKDAYDYKIEKYTEE